MERGLGNVTAWFNVTSHHSETMASSMFSTETIDWKGWLAIVLAAITGVIHLVLGVGNFPDPLALSFLVAGLGFFGGIVLFLMEYRRRLLVVLAIPYVAAQIALFYLLNMPTVATLSPVAIVDKAVQLVLIVLLILLYREE